MGFLFHAELFLHPRRERAHVREGALSPMDDAQAGCMDGPIWQFGLCGLWALYYVVPGGN